MSKILILIFAVNLLGCNHLELSSHDTVAYTVLNSGCFKNKFRFSSTFVGALEDSVRIPCEEASRMFGIVINGERENNYAAFVAWIKKIYKEAEDHNFLDSLEVDLEPIDKTIREEMKNDERR